MELHPLIVGSERVTQGSNVLSVTNPFDGSVVGRVVMGDEKTLDAAIGAAQHAFETATRYAAPFERSAILAKAADLMRQRRTEFAETILAEAGKPITMAETEVDRCVMTLTAAAEEARRSHGEMLDLDGLPPGKGHVGLVQRF